MSLMKKPMSCGTVSCLTISMASLADASGVPCVDGCDELGCLPVDLVVLDVRVLDNGGLLKISSAAVWWGGCV